MEIYACLKQDLPWRALDLCRAKKNVTRSYLMWPQKGTKTTKTEFYTL